MELAVFGAHMQGQPLNGQLRALGAKFIEWCRTRAAYRMYTLGGAGPPRPGLIHVAGAEGDAGIDGEIWSLPLGHVGAFLATITPPLGPGTVELADGRAIKGFVCEGRAREASADITAYGGWRRNRAAQP